MKLLMTLIMLITSAASVANAGKEGGGGDPSEARVSEIRKDILSWIKAGGSTYLDMPSHITLAEYNEKMIDILQPKKVKVTFIKKDHPRKEHLQVSVDGHPKTCRGFYRKGKPNIICSIPRYRYLSESEEYQLIHHEFAGLVSVEQNDGSHSDYRVSNQITGYLEEQTVKKLAVRAPFTRLDDQEKSKVMSRGLLSSLYVKYLQCSIVSGSTNTPEDELSNLAYEELIGILKRGEEIGRLEFLVQNNSSDLSNRKIIKFSYFFSYNRKTTKTLYLSNDMKQIEEFESTYSTIRFEESNRGTLLEPDFHTERTDEEYLRSNCKVLAYK